MTLQMRPHGTDAVPYAPARDIVHLLRPMTQQVATRMEEEQHKPLHAWLRQREITPDDLGKVIEAFMRLMTDHQEHDTVDVALERAGWFEVKDEARIALAFYLGAQMVGTMWQGIRDVSAITDELLTDVERLAGLGDKVQLALSKPRWRRWLSRTWHRCRMRLAGISQ